MPSDPTSSTLSVRGVTFTSSHSPLERIKLFLSHHATAPPVNGFDKTLVRENLRLVSATQNSCVFELLVAPQLARDGTLHVGAATTVFDVVTTMAMVPGAGEGGRWMLLGVSRNLNVTSIKPVVVGTALEVEAKVVSKEGWLATITGVMREKETGSVVSMCEHLKFDFGSQTSKL